MEKILGKESKPELAHVDMGARLIEAGLKQLAKHPCLWPPTLAVRLFRGERGWFGLCLQQVRELASKHRALRKAGEKKPFIAADLKK